MNKLDERTAHKRSGRVNFRVDPTVDEVLREAAEIEHKTLSAFVLDAAYEKAKRSVEESTRLKVSAMEFSRVLDELDKPTEVVEPLFKLAERVARLAKQ